jgi:hypothetical protein
MKVNVGKGALWKIQSFFFFFSSIIDNVSRGIVVFGPGSVPLHGGIIGQN